MSGVGLLAFRAAALQSGSGEVRFAQGEGNNELINKGSRGQRFVTWWKSIFSSEADPTRAARQTAANEAFRSAMVREYGATVAETALRSAGLQSGQTLTGDRIIRAIDRAKGDEFRTGDGQGILAPLPPSQGFRPQGSTQACP